MTNPRRPFGRRAGDYRDWAGLLADRPIKSHHEYLLKWTTKRLYVA